MADLEDIEQVRPNKPKTEVLLISVAVALIVILAAAVLFAKTMGKKATPPEASQPHKTSLLVSPAPGVQTLRPGMQVSPQG